MRRLWVVHLHLLRKVKRKNDDSKSTRQKGYPVAGVGAVLLRAPSS